MRASASYHSGAMAHRNKLSGASVSPDINELVAANLLRILGDRSPEAYCKETKLKYVSGAKKGKAVAPRALRYAVDAQQSPRLDLIAAIALKEDLHPYQLLFFEFDPNNAPVMISKAQADLIRRLQDSPKQPVPAGSAIPQPELDKRQ